MLNALRQLGRSLVPWRSIGLIASAALAVLALAALWQQQHRVMVIALIGLQLTLWLTALSYLRTAPIPPTNSSFRQKLRARWQALWQKLLLISLLLLALGIIWLSSRLWHSLL